MFSNVEEVVETMALVERNQPFSLNMDKVYSRWAVLDAGQMSKTICGKFFESVPLTNVVENRFRFRHDSGVCYESLNHENEITAATVVLCKNRIEIAEWKTVLLCNPTASFIERFDNRQSFQKRVAGKSIWIVSKSVFQKIPAKPARLVCSIFGLTDEHAKFTWVLGFSPHSRNSIRFIPDRRSWIRPSVVGQNIHQLFKITDFMCKGYTIPKIQTRGNYSCVVCFEEDVSRKLQLECRHQVCFSCLWGCVASGHYLCPVCRSHMDRTFVVEHVDDIVAVEQLHNYEVVLSSLLSSKIKEEKWIVFQKTSHGDIGSGLFKFLHKDDGVFLASSLSVGFPEVDMTIVDAVVISQEHGCCKTLLQSFLNNALSFHRSKPLVIHCLFFDVCFLNETKKYVRAFFE
jgi:hypothetical protein